MTTVTSNTLEFTRTDPELNELLERIHEIADVWHGVRVPEPVILAPETLTSEDLPPRAECGSPPGHPGAHGPAVCAGTGRTRYRCRAMRDALRGSVASG